MQVRWDLGLDRDALVVDMRNCAPQVMKHDLLSDEMTYEATYAMSLGIAAIGAASVSIFKDGSYYARGG